MALATSAAEVATHALPVRGDEHRQVETADGDPVLVALLPEQQRDLVPGGSTLEVDEEQDLVLVLEAGDGLEQLGAKVGPAPISGMSVTAATFSCGPKIIWPDILYALGERAMTG